MKISKMFVLIVVSVLGSILLASVLNSFLRVGDSALADRVTMQRANEQTLASPTTATKNYLPIIFLNAPGAVNCIYTINGIAGGTVCNGDITLQLAAGGVLTSASGYGLRVNNTGGAGTAALYGKFGAGSGSSAGNGAGVWGDSASGAAILGTSDTGYGVAALSNSGTAVFGTAYGSAPAINGNGLGIGPAVSGNGYIGVDGVGSSLGVRGTGDITGVMGISHLALPSYGVFGQQGGGSGIFFLSSAGVWGDSKSSYGLVGTSLSGTAIYGSSQNGVAMHLQRSVNGTATNPNDNVAIIENTNTNNSADVLALKIGMTITPTQSNNFVTFLNGNNASVGAIQGNNAGSVEYVGAGNDYAEYLPRAQATESFRAGDIVGVFNGRISKTTRGAHQLMVISSAPIVLGNDPGENKRDGYERVAFIGQARVRVRGIIRAGDLIIPSGDDDGVGIAVSPETISAEQFAQVVGQAWEASDEANEKFVNVAVGLTRSDPALVRLIVQNETFHTELDAVTKQNNELVTRLANVETRLDTLNPDQFAHPFTVVLWGALIGVGVFVGQRWH